MRVFRSCAAWSRTEGFSASEPDNPSACWTRSGPRDQVVAVPVKVSIGIPLVDAAEVTSPAWPAVERAHQPAGRPGRARGST